MTTAYPGALDAFTNPSGAMSSGTRKHSQQHGDLNDAMEAVQGELGTNPSGTDATVKARLDRVDTGLTRRSGPVLVTLGDSITLGGATPSAPSDANSWPMWASVLSGGKVRLARNAGISGNTTAAMIARFDTDVTAYSPDVVVISGGTNDIAGAVAAATTRTNIATLVASVRALGARPVLTTIPPRASYLTDTQALNTWLKLYASSEGLPLIDFYALLVDPETGEYEAASDSGDGVHPSFAARKVMGQAAADIIGPLVRAWTPPFPASRLDTGGGIIGSATDNALLEFDTGGSGIPNGWTASGAPSGGTATHALVTDSEVAGSMAQITQSTNATPRLLSRTSSGSWAVGDRIAIVGVVTSDGGVSTRVRVQFVGAGSAQYATPYHSDQPVTRGVIWQEYVIPASTTAVLWQFYVDAGSGVASFGVPNIVNLTALGLA